MKRKYYLRGMGVGIFVTALIFTIALLFEKPTLSDEEIIRQAKKLGMVEAESTDSTGDGSDSADTSADENGSKDSSAAADADSSGNSSADGTDSASSDGTAADGTNADGTSDAADNTGDAAGDVSNDGTKTLTEDQAAEDAQAAENAINNTDLSNASTGYKSNISDDSASSSPSGLISVTITAGQNSAKVAENLYRAGLIDNPISFDDYLEQNGYDARIRPGTYSIASGSSYEKIANAIASRK